MSIATLQPFYEGWAKHQALVIDTLLGLTPEQLELRTAPHQWAVWQLAGHVAGSRAYWFNDVLGEGDPATRDLFRVERTTVPDLPLANAGWEDDEDHPRNTPRNSWTGSGARGRSWTTAFDAGPPRNWMHRSCDRRERITEAGPYGT